MKFLKNTFLFFLTSFCMVLLMEFYFAQTESIENLKPEFNEDLGVVYLKNQKFSFFSEGWGMGRTNNHGFLGQNYSIRKSKKFRIAFLGDSYVQGLQVLEREHFINQCKNSLKTYKGAEVEVLNFGTSGYDLSSMYCYYKKRVQEFKPDLLIFCIDQNDLNDNFSSKKQNLLYPYTQISNDSLMINNDFRETGKYQFYQKNQFAFHLNFTKIARNIYFLSTREKLSILFDKFYNPVQQKKEILPLPKQDQAIPKVSQLTFQELKKTKRNYRL